MCFHSEEPANVLVHPAELSKVASEEALVPLSGQDDWILRIKEASRQEKREREKWKSVSHEDDGEDINISINIADNEAGPGLGPGSVSPSFSPPQAPQAADGMHMPAVLPTQVYYQPPNLPPSSIQMVNPVSNEVNVQTMRRRQTNAASYFTDADIPLDVSLTLFTPYALYYAFSSGERKA